MEQVGFLGVGAMGGAIAARLVQNGVPVLAYDPNAEVLAKARARGASTAESVEDVVNRVEVVFACLPNAPICREVALGRGGVIEGSKVPANDVWIAASAMQHGARVLTTDRHFSRIVQIISEVFPIG